MAAAYRPADTSQPVLDTTVGGVLRDAAASAPTQLALVGTSVVDGAPRRWRYEELLQDAERAAAALLTRFEPGDRVAVWAPNFAEWVVLEFGAALAGVVLVTVNPAFKAKEVDYVLRQSRSCGLFHVRDHRGNPMAGIVDSLRPGLPELRDVVALETWTEFLASGREPQRWPAVGPEDEAQIQYTSGTTGFPKGALLHHRGITNNARFTAQRCGVEPGDVWVNPMPLFHTGGCVLGTLGPVQQQAAQVCVLTFDPAAVLGHVEQERATMLGGVPTMLIALMEHPSFSSTDTAALRGVLSGGSAVPAELVRRIESTLGVSFSIVYGQTEASPVITQTDKHDTPEDKATTIGRPLPQTEVKIVDPSTGETVGTGESGELCTRGYLVMKGYFELPEATAEAIDSDGWLHTGDLCSMDERGYSTVVGRLKDMIIRGGENIYPREIEEVLFAHPAVADVAVVGVPDEKWGEQVAAFVRPVAGRPRDEELIAHVRENLAPHKTPKVWVYVDEFPLTASGKIQKYVLREQFEQSAAGASDHKGEAR